VVIMHLTSPLIYAHSLQLLLLHSYHPVHHLLPINDRRDSLLAPRNNMRMMIMMVQTVGRMNIHQNHHCYQNPVSLTRQSSGRTCTSSSPPCQTPAAQLPPSSLSVGPHNATLTCCTSSIFDSNNLIFSR
jgi:hypothetical protein